MRSLIRLFFAALLTAGSMSLNAQGMIKVIAHRGHWKVPGSAQNSIASLVKADSINCFGSEFDIWMTRDGEVVVNHDRKFKDVVIEEAPASQVLAITLDNGEKLPTLSSLLDAAQNTDVRLICELKTHADKKQEAELVRKTVKMMADKGLSHRVDYITFSREAMLELIKQAPKGTPVYYLNGEMTPEELKAVGAAGFDYNINVLKKHPEWIRQAHDLGLKTNAWTVDEEADMQWCIDNGIDFLTTNRPERLFRLLW